jgi:hypothetical protein
LTSLIGLDTSVAVPLLVQTHRVYSSLVAWWRGRPVALSGHALAETYSVLTRLPGDIRLGPQHAARLLNERIAPSLLVGPDAGPRLPDILSSADIAGGAVYDALVAPAVGERRCARDSRRAGKGDLRNCSMRMSRWSSE